MMNKMMKKVAIVLAAATMAIAGSAVAASANDGIRVESRVLNYSYTVSPDYGTYYVNNEIGLNVRELPSKEAASLGAVYTGDAVNVTGRLYENGEYTYWVQINFNGQTAYVRDCLQSTKPEQAPVDQTVVTTVVEPENTDSYGYKEDSNFAEKDEYTVNVAPGSYLALRNAPTSDGDSEFGQLYAGDKVRVIEGNGQFWFVYSASADRCGYVNSNYLV